MEINRKKQVKRFKEIELDLRMRLMAKITKGAEQSANRAGKVEGGCESEGLDEDLNANHDSLTYQGGAQTARRNQEE